MAYISKRRISPPSDKKERVKRHNEKWNHYYGSVAWKHLRDYYKSLHPICQECMINGRSVPAEHLHHRIPFSWFDLEEDRRAALLDIENLEPVCAECHSKIHQHLYKPDNFEQTTYYKKIHFGLDL